MSTLDVTDMIVSLVRSSRRIMFFTGAGVSTLAGMPDFQSLLRENSGDGRLFTHSGFLERPDLFYEKYGPLIFPMSPWRPSRLHSQMAELEKLDKDITVVTLNHDLLHEEAGSRRIYHPHGSVGSFSCVCCNKKFTYSEAFQLSRTGTNGVPRCACGKILRPDIVLFNEIVDYKRLTEVKNSVRHVDLVIILGTAKRVAPACEIVDVARVNAPSVVVNRDLTDYDRGALKLNSLEEFSHCLDSVCKDKHEIVR